jgi:hypothetical protein
MEWRIISGGNRLDLTLPSYEIKSLRTAPPEDGENYHDPLEPSRAQSICRATTSVLTERTPASASESSGPPASVSR